MNIRERIIEWWERYKIPPASAEAAVVSLEAGATLIVPKEDVRHIVRLIQIEDRLPVLESRPTGDGMVVLKRGRKPRRKKR